MSKFDELSSVLFDGEIVAADFKTMPGTGENLSRDENADELLRSLNRVGLVRNGKLVDPAQ